MKFSVFQLSRKGGRQKNEDRMGYCYTRGAGLFLLADGMGGHPEGEVAAQLALQAMSALFQKSANPVVEDPKGFLTDAALAAHRQILRHAMDHDLHDNPRTTVVAGLVQDGALHTVHCGDSRLYVVRNGEMLFRTRDHSYAEQRLQDEQAGAGGLGSGVRPLPMAANRNILYTCLGSPTKPVMDLKGPLHLEHGDRVLLCSDGLWGSLDDNEIIRGLAAQAVPQAVPELVEAALRKAGASSDNVTVLALEWESTTGFEETRANVSTEDIDEGGFASTMQAGMPQADEADDLDDAAIERSIAEINEPIRRSASRRR
jgi:PPM family protein phosphatase